MKTASTPVNQNKNIVRIAIATVVILCVPLVAMQFNSGVNWAALDFIVAGVLIFGTGLIYEFVVRRVRDRNRRLALAAAVAVVFAYLWAELAVGIFTHLGG